jgi:predicted esterase
MWMASSDHPHDGGAVLQRGAQLAGARLAIILVHGRGDSAGGILGLVDAFDAPDVAWLAPEASGHTWYPYSFLSPIAHNEPGISSGLRVIESLVARLAAAAIPPERVVLMGFSQGACLAQEFAARHARRYHAIVGLSGGLIGPAGTPRDYSGSFEGTPVFLGCSDIDPHIPLERVHESALVFKRMGAVVDERIYPRMGHTVNDDEIAAVQKLLAG